MAFDLNARLANDIDISADSDGTWTKLWDTSSSGNYTAQSGTMYVANPYRALAEFRLWLRGVTVTGAPDRVDLVIDIEEADDNSGTNARPVCRLRMGSGQVDATPSGYAYTKTANSTDDEQFQGVGLVTKPFVRYTADVTITGGSSPTVSFDNVTIYAMGLESNLHNLPAAG